MALPHLRIRVAVDQVDRETELPSYDLQGLCALSVLQLRERDSFLVEPIHSTDEPSLGDVSGLPQIIRTRAPLGATDERAYLALALSRLSALIEHTLYSLPANFTQVTRPAHAAGLPLPARYLVPGQLRLRVKERLEREGLWGLGGDVDQEEAAQKREKLAGADADLIKKAQEEQNRRKERIKLDFEKLKIVELARQILAPFSARLAGNTYFGGEAPSTLDAIVFAHLALALYLPLPTPVVHTLLKDAYPELVSHTEHMRQKLFPPSGRSEWPQMVAPQRRDWSPLWLFMRKDPVRRKATSVEQDELRKQQIIWAAICTTSYLAFAVWQGIITLPSFDSRSEWLGGANLRGERDEDHAMS